MAMAMPKKNTNDSSPLLPATTPEGASLAGYAMHRERHDSGWAVGFFVTALLTFASGIYGVKNYNKRFSEYYTDGFKQDAKNCPADPTRRLLLEEGEPDTHPLVFLKHASAWLLVTAVGAGFIGYVFVRAFQHNAHAMLKAAVVIKVATPATFSLIMFATGNLLGGAIFALWALFMAWVVNSWRDKFELCGRLLSVGSSALSQLPGVISLALGLNLSSVIVLVPYAGLAIVSLANGKIEPFPGAIPATGAGEVGCVDENDNQVDCCMWQLETWVPFHLFFTFIWMTWAACLAFEIRTFSIAGAVCQWYYAPAGTTQFKGATWRSLGHALGPQFGSLCFGAAVLTWAAMIRRLAESLRRQRNIVACLVATVLDCLAALIEFLTKFATIRAAITGERFWEAATKSTDLLKRNLMSTVAVWYFPQMVLSLLGFFVAAFWGAAVGLLSYGVELGERTERKVAGNEAVLLGFLAFFIALVAIQFFSTLLLSIVDSVYYCYAIDKDHSAVTNVMVHDVYVLVTDAQARATNAGPVVEQPDGELGYGSPQDGQPQGYPQNYPQQTTSPRYYATRPQ